MRYADFRVAGILFALVIVSTVLSIAFVMVIPIEAYLPKLDTSQIFSLAPGVSVEEDLKSSKEEWERRV
ncbi:MAG: hypothetical protein GY696_12240, partial [Gammaproteobacteria bacterium]|nr:hypothetical protein [Gammaproteobacteria bacterium]